MRLRGVFCCHECGASSPRWEGRCSRCGAWGTLEDATPEDERSSRRNRLDRGPGVQPDPPVALCDLSTEDVPRMATGIGELDRVLGGGAVPGTTIMLGGEPGIGKSTLLLALAAHAGSDAIYFAGEESPDQVARRARRLGLSESALLLHGSTKTEEVAELIRRKRPRFAIIDSVQTLQTKDATGGPGGPSQVRAAAELLVPAARCTGTALFLVGQVTKIGGLAGPRALEHAVDVVLMFEGDRHMSLRAVRGVKNRFGPTDEIGLFEMRENGLVEVRNASATLLATRGPPGPGIVVGIAVEGRRPVCLEVQALVVGEDRQGAARRSAELDPRRLQLLVSCLETLYTKTLSKRDIFVKVVGGLRTRDPGLDFAIAASILGAHRGVGTSGDAVAIGEIGLRGEVRGAPRMMARLKEARAMGFTRAFVPLNTPAVDGIELIETERVGDLLNPATRGFGDKSRISNQQSRHESAPP